MNIPLKKYYLAGTIDRFEGKLAVIKTEDGQEIKWPITNLPENIEEGASIRLAISNSASDEKEKEEIAEKMLNEILKPKQSNG